MRKNPLKLSITRQTLRMSPGRDMTNNRLSYLTFKKSMSSIKGKNEAIFEVTTFCNRLMQVLRISYRPGTDANTSNIT